MNIFSIYLMINMVAIIIIFTYEERKVFEALVLIPFLPIFLIYFALYRFFTDWIFDLKSLILFGRGRSPITVTEAMIIGRRGSTLSYTKRLFGEISEEDKKEYIRVNDKAKAARESWRREK